MRLPDVVLALVVLITEAPVKLAQTRLPVVVIVPVILILEDTNTLLQVRFSTKVESPPINKLFCVFIKPLPM